MKNIVYIMITALLFAAGCSKKEKKFIPFSSNGTESAPLQSGTANTNVTGATLSKIQVSPADQSIAKNTHATYTATGIYSDGTIKDISNDCSWSVKSETDKASTVASKKGRFLGTAVTSTGTPAKISASYNSLSGDANLNITNATLSSIQISSIPSLIPGGTAQYIATGIFSDGTTQDISSLVTWSTSSASNVAIDATTGIGTGGSTAGTATITATLASPSTFPTVANGGVATTTTQLKNVTIVSITVTGVATIGAGNTTNYLASAIYSDGTSSDITTQATWSLSSSVNASISDATGSKGFLTAVNAGSVTVQATYAGSTGSKAVTISAITVSSIVVSPSSKSIIAGTTTQFTATATYSDGSTGDVTNSAVWSSSSTSVAGVNTSSSTGGLTQGISSGSSTITATTGGKSGSASLTVSSATLVSIAITGSDSDGSIAKGTTNQYTAIGTYSNGATQDISTLVTWSSSNSNATISNTTGTKGLATGITQGNSSIQATLSGVSSNASALAITTATLTSIAISGSATVATGVTKQYVATGTFSDTTTQDITSLVTWISGSSSNATISNAVSDKGKAYALAAGTSNITASLANGTNGIVTTGSATITSNTSVLTISATTTSGTTSQSIAGYNVTLPSTLTAGNTPTGNFTGITYSGGTNIAGFIANIPNYGQTSCQTLGTTILGMILADSPDLVTASNQIGSSVINFTGGCTIVYNQSVTTNADKKPTELSNHLIANVGVNTVGGNVTTTSIVPVGTEVATSSFRVVVQVTHNTAGGNDLIGVGISNSSDYAANEAILTGFLNGTNISSSSATFASKTDSFTGIADPLVDFVWVVDNSGSMAEEQTAVQNAATTFFSKLGNKHLDYRLGVLATGGTGTNSCTDNPGTHKAWELWGTGWTTSANGSAGFTANVSSVGTNGCGTESGIHSAEKALNLVNIAPRPGAKLIFVMLSDEGDQWGCYQGTYLAGANNPGSPYDPCSGRTPFNVNSNIFKTNGYKVYTVSGLDATTGLSGTCSVAPTVAAYTNNFHSGYYDLAVATGGSSASICSSDYNSIMDNIVTQAAGSSGYVLSRTPMSSSLVVKVNGVDAAQDATNGWQYNSASKSIVFAGTAWPASGAAITVSYTYDESVALANTGDSNLMAYISKTAKSDTARGAAAAIALLVGAILAGRIFKNRKNS